MLVLHVTFAYKIAQFQSKSRVFFLLNSIPKIHNNLIRNTGLGYVMFFFVCLIGYINSKHDIAKLFLKSVNTLETNVVFSPLISMRLKVRAVITPGQRKTVVVCYFISCFDITITLRLQEINNVEWTQINKQTFNVTTISHFCCYF